MTQHEKVELPTCAIYSKMRWSGMEWYGLCDWHRRRWLDLHLAKKKLWSTPLKLRLRREARKNPRCDNRRALRAQFSTQRGKTNNKKSFWGFHFLSRLAVQCRKQRHCASVWKNGALREHCLHLQVIYVNFSTPELSICETFLPFKNCSVGGKVFRSGHESMNSRLYSKPTRWAAEIAFSLTSELL